MNGAKAIANDINFCVPCAAKQLLKVANVTDGVVALAATRTEFRRATVLAKKSLDGTNNAGNVSLGASAQANEQPYLLSPGDEISLEAPLGAKWDLRDWYIKVAADGDGVVVICS